MTEFLLQEIKHVPMTAKAARPPRSDANKIMLRPPSIISFFTSFIFYFICILFYFQFVFENILYKIDKKNKKGKKDFQKYIALSFKILQIYFQFTFIKIFLFPFTIVVKS